MHKQFVVSMKDLRFATLLCQSCGTRVTLDLGSEFQPHSGAAPFKAPQDCPRCGKRFDSVLPNALATLQQIYKATAGLGNALSFNADLEI